MKLIEVNRDGVLWRSGWGKRHTTYFEEIDQVSHTGRTLQLGLHLGSTLQLVTPWHTVAEISTRLSAIVSGESDALQRVTDRPTLSSEIARWMALGGFSAAPFARFLAEAAAKLGSSDVHIEPTSTCYRLSIRQCGTLQTIADLPTSVGRRLLGRLKVLCGAQVHRRDIVQEGRAVFGSGNDVRLSFVPAVWGESATLRLFDRLKGVATLGELGFEGQALTGLQNLLAKPRGIILFVGPSASGKTTSLYTSLRSQLATAQQTRRVITVEDPVEYRLGNVVQLEVDPGRGNTYEVLLKSALRQDANILVVGEIRDRVTAELAIRAGMTGHQVLSTLHAGSSGEAIMRLVELGIAPTQICSAVTGIVAQELEGRTCPDCQGDGPSTCACQGSGLVGRRARADVLSMNARLARIICANPTEFQLSECFHAS